MEGESQKGGKGVFVLIFCRYMSSSSHLGRTLELVKAPVTSSRRMVVGMPTLHHNRFEPPCLTGNYFVDIIEQVSGVWRTLRGSFSFGGGMYL